MTWNTTHDCIRDDVSTTNISLCSAKNNYQAKKIGWSTACRNFEIVASPTQHRSSDYTRVCQFHRRVEAWLVSKDAIGLSGYCSNCRVLYGNNCVQRSARTSAAHTPSLKSRARFLNWLTFFRENITGSIQSFKMSISSTPSPSYAASAIIQASDLVCEDGQ